MARPERPKFNIVKPPAGLSFTEKAVSTHGVYYRKLAEAVASDSAIQVIETDKYLQNMLRFNAKKMGLKLVYAAQDGMLYIKPITQSEDERKLLVLLRMPRTTNVLKGHGLQLDMVGTLRRFRESGLVSHTPTSDSWELTTKGKELLEQK